MHPLIRTLIFTVVVPGTMTVLVPRWLLRGAPPNWNDWHALGIVPIALGAALYLWCGWNFAMRGRGTPGPWDPPRKLVVSGPYRYVRNPMYVAVGTIVLGEAVLFASRDIFYFFCLGALMVNLFVFLYEEPTLRQLFGEDYDAYCRSVSRWLPGSGNWKIENGK